MQTMTKQTNPAELLAQLPISDVENVHGVTFDGELAWLATGDRLLGIDPVSGEERRSFEVPSEAGTAFDGEHLWQLAGGKIRRVNRDTGEVMRTIDAPEGGVNISGMAFAEGHLWLGGYKDKRILKLDPETAKVVRVIETDRYVTGVSWTDGGLWCGASYDGEPISELRRIEPDTGNVAEAITLPEGVNCSGLEVNSAGGQIYFGSGPNLRTAKLPSSN